MATVVDCRVAYVEGKASDDAVWTGGELPRERVTMGNKHSSGWS